MKTNTGNDVYKLYGTPWNEAIKMYNISGGVIYGFGPYYPVRGVQVGDNLSNKKLYFNFPVYSFGDGETQGYPNVTRQIINCGANNYFAYSDYYSESNHIWIQSLHIYSGGSYWQTVYSYDGYGGPAYINEVAIELPSSFGTVTSIASDSNIYPYIQFEVIP